MNTPNLSMNQVLWYPVCLNEIMRKSAFLTDWEWGFIGKIRPKIEKSVPLNTWEQNKLAEIHKYLMYRKAKPVGKPQKPKPQTSKQFWNNFEKNRSKK